MNKKAIFIGSSVSLGIGSTDSAKGWRSHITALLEENGWEVSDCSIGGQTTADILLRLQKDVIDKGPDVCFVGLGLANEGMAGTAASVDGEIVRGIFESNMAKIVRALKSAGIFPVVGGVYPNNRYQPFHYEILKESNAALKTAYDGEGSLYLDWLSAIDDGNGRFKEGIYHDAGHPNDRGYEMMANAVKKKVFEIV